MKFIYVVRTSIHTFPPCISQICYLHQLGEEVIILFGECDPNTKVLFENMGIKTYDIQIHRSKYKYIGKIESYIEFKKKTDRILREVYAVGDIVWYGTADSCFALGNTYNRYPYILNVLELYDNNSFYRNQTKRICRDAVSIVACENTRAEIMKIWYQLEQKPIVMPNKPYSVLDVCEEGSIDETKHIIKKIGDKKIILYQGIIAADRDLGKLAKALKILNRDDLYLALMGKEITDSIDRIQKEYEKTLYLGYVPAPYHLEVTSKAFIGVAYYDKTSLNNLFCAPNKIYEYSGLKVPVLCNDVPGLINTIGKYQAGECVNFDDIQNVVLTIQKMIEHHDQYIKNSDIMFKSVDNLEVIKSIIRIAKIRTETVD